MCGIIGVVGNQNAVSLTLEGLKKLEYRGYDSAGIAVLENGSIKVAKEEGKIVNLESLVCKLNLSSTIAIGHTRWATHGRPNRENAHPHSSSKVSVVHNGIIENYQELKKFLQERGVKFLSETDSEVLPHLIEYHLDKIKNIEKAILETSKMLKGTYSIAVIFADNLDLIAIAKNGSPLLVAKGENENYIASDYYAIGSHSNQIAVLDDGEFALITSKSTKFFNQEGQEIIKEFKFIESITQKNSKGDFAHFMLKEIYEQSQVIEDTIQSYVDLYNYSIQLPNFPFDLKKINKITIIGCGTSYYAGLVAKYLFEEIAKIEVEVDIASEFRYRSHVFREDNLMIFISQSGETADTLAALKHAKENGQKTLAIVNVTHSSIASIADSIIRTVAGPEIGVASTKAYIAQVTNLAILAIHLADIQNKISKEKRKHLINEIIESSLKITQILKPESIKQIQSIAQSLVNYKNILYIGRGVSHVTSFEAALKLRELSYINAQAIAAGELKHGTIALIDDEMMVIAIMPSNPLNILFEKSLSNVQEVKARGGKIIAITDQDSTKHLQHIADSYLTIPKINGIIEESLVCAVPTQLLAYFVALFKGNDVDQPRNLAKSVTVE